MYNEVVFFEIMRKAVLFMTPLVFLEGILLLLSRGDKYAKIEETLGKEIGGIKKRLVPTLETNIYNFHKWLLSKKSILGWFCIFYAIVLFVILKRYR